MWVGVFGVILQLLESELVSVYLQRFYTIQPCVDGFGDNL